LKTDISNINDDYLKKLFEIVDIVYFNNELAKCLESNNITIHFECTDTLTNTAGVCRKNGGVKIFTEPFKNFDKQETLGLFCYNPLMCMINTFLHEIIHLIMFSFCSILGKGNGGHTETFVS
jgi:hypothetical protein